ncbi:MAG: undecaprenyl-diphosphate phosphatase [bacterium]|nr:undecaprenyl-diphosphate phosphatase [bacterium]
MDLIQAVLMGITQGLSEFLPISSSAHLVFTSGFYKISNGLEIVQDSNQEVFFDIMLHFGTLIAVLIFFRKDIWNIIKSLYLGIKNNDYANQDCKLGIYIILGTIITVLVAYPLCGISEKLVFMPSGVGILLILTGLLLLFSEFYAKKHQNDAPIGLKKACLIGMAQGFASIPGFSRSGLTIATGLLTGMSRTTAARYSFLLSIPVIVGASMIYPFMKINPAEIVDYNWMAIILGTIVSAVVGYFCIKYFLKFVSKFSLSIFGWYCVIAGIFTTIFFNMH